MKVNMHVVATSIDQGVVECTCGYGFMVDLQSSLHLKRTDTGRVVAVCPNCSAWDGRDWVKELTK